MYEKSIIKNAVSSVKKKRYVFLALSGVFIVMAYMPIIFMLSEHPASKSGYSFSLTWSLKMRVDMFYYNPYLAYLIVIFVISGIVACILHEFGKKHRLIDLGIYLPVVSFFLFLVMSIQVFTAKLTGAMGGGLKLIPGNLSIRSEYVTKYGYYGFTPLWGYFVECIILALICILCLQLANRYKNNND